MSNLYVVRHGQASFFAEDYDQLSLVGETQSRLLGEYWAHRNVRFDHVYTGPCRRHVDTARIVGEVFQTHGLAWPEPIVLAGLDEYEAEAVLKQALPRLVEEHEHIRQLHRDMECATDNAEKLRAFQKVYEVVIDRWAHGELDLPHVESWAAFCQRVHRCLTRSSPVAGAAARRWRFPRGGRSGSRCKGRWASRTGRLCNWHGWSATRPSASFSFPASGSH